MEGGRAVRLPLAGVAETGAAARRPPAPASERRSIMAKESGDKDKSVLDDKQKFDKAGTAKEDVAHMGDKPKASERAPRAAPPKAEKENPSARAAPGRHTDPGKPAILGNSLLCRSGVRITSASLPR